jgi:cytochrome P450
LCVNLRSLLHDTKVFPDPTHFDPSRWLGSGEELALRNKYFMPFSKGHRNCIGQNLAWAELYLATATVFRRFDLELHDVDYERDVRLVRDCFVGMSSPESQSIRVRVLGKRE